MGGDDLVVLNASAPKGLLNPATGVDACAAVVAVANEKRRRVVHLG
jgi:hypothetical protein